MKKIEYLICFAFSVDWASLAKQWISHKEDVDPAQNDFSMNRPVMPMNYVQPDALPGAAAQPHSSENSEHDNENSQGTRLYDYFGMTLSLYYFLQ